MADVRTVFITGASRGIGKAIALRLAAGGARIVIAAKSVTEDPRLGGTIYSAADEIRQAGGEALPVPCDIRDEEQLQRAVGQAVEAFGGIDVLINNASAISLTGTEQTSAKRYDLMQDVNVRGSFMAAAACLPYLKKSPAAHILTLSPPLHIDPKWFAPHAAYTISKYNMSMLTLAWAAEFRPYRIAANSLWPATLIGTAAIRNLPGGEVLTEKSRSPEIVAEAAWYMLGRDPAAFTGNFCTDEEVLRSEGITDFSRYNNTPGAEPVPDLFL